MFEPCSFFFLRAPLLPLSMAEQAVVEGLQNEMKAVMGDIEYVALRVRRQVEPQALYAGVAVGSIESRTQMRLSACTDHQSMARPDQQWLWQVVNQLEAQMDVIRELRIRTHPLVFYRESRAWFPYQNKPPYTSVSIGLNPVIEYLLKSAQEPLAWSALLGDASARFSELDKAKLEGLMLQLFEHRFLISELHTTLIGGDPGAALVRMGHLPQIRSILERLSAYNVAQLGQGAKHFRELVASMQELAPAQTPVQVEIALATQALSLGREVALEAANAAEILSLLATGTADERAMADYTKRFQACYGGSTRVPLADLLDPDRGLGAPAGYLCPPMTTVHVEAGLDWAAERDQCLRTWLAKCQATGSRVLELTAERLAELTARRGKIEGAPPRSIELCVQIVAPIAEAVDRGEYQLIVNGRKSAVGAGSLTARYQHLLGEQVTRELYTLQEQEQQREPNSILAEVAYVPADKHLANVVQTGRFRSHEIVLDTFSEEAGSHRLLIDDLVVGCEGDRLTLYSKRCNRRVIPTFAHRLNQRMMPNLYRFLYDLSTVGQRPWSAFSWGEKEREVFLPRLTAGRIVLAPARWNVEKRTDTQLASRMAEWPRRVQVRRGYEYLLLDLQRDEERKVLENWYEQAAEHEVLVVEEAWFGEDDCFVESIGEGYSLMECVLPLLSKEQERSQYE